MLNEAICAADAASCRKFFLLLNIYCDPQPPTPPFSPHMSQYLLRPPHTLTPPSSPHLGILGGQNITAINFDWFY